jgi:hypothetical protein
MAKKSDKEASGKIKIQYYRSVIGYSAKQKRLSKAWNDQAQPNCQRPDTRAMRNRREVPHLLRIVD